MSRIMDKEEFMASLRFAAAEEDAEMAISEPAEEMNMSAADPEEDPKARRKPGPKPKKQTRKRVQKAVQKAVEQNDTTDEPTSAVRQEEALRAMIALTEGFTQHLIRGSERALNTADKLADMAQIYTGYIETVEEMIK